MYLLILQNIVLAYKLSQNYLHPTMYLLIQVLGTHLHKAYAYLHPTMYLLIQQLVKDFKDKFNNLHPTMYLLILSVFVEIILAVVVIYIPLCIY